MGECKKDCGSFAFLFWLDLATLIILVPWAFINGDMVALYSSPSSALDWFNLMFTALLGGVRFFSQIIVLRVTTATNLSCANLAFQAINIYLSIALFHKPTINGFIIGGTLFTIASSGFYTYLKMSKVLTKRPECIKFGKQFEAAVTCNRSQQQPGDETLVAAP